MKISIFGSGYVGLVTGVCLAARGHDVICVDINKERIDLLNTGFIPIYEPGLDRILKKSIKNKKISFTTNSKKAVIESKLIFIAVGTPPAEDGSADLQYVLDVAKNIGDSINAFKVVINKSTVPVGSQKKVKNIISKQIKKRNKEIKFSVCSNPEFLKEGAAINDFNKPDRIICGIEDGDKKSKKLLEECYKPFIKKNNDIIFMKPEAAELTKYAANAMLATKISFMNELSQISDILNIDINEVRNGIGSDSRIGYQFINPGCGYGGSCFPKDVKALIDIAKKNSYQPKILKSIESVNKEQKNLLFKKVDSYFNGNLQGKTFGLWGVSFKPETDDIREAPSINLIKSLLKAGAIIKAYDPVALESLKQIFPKTQNMIYTNSPENSAKNAECLIICTEWNEFKEFNIITLKKLLNSALIFDGRNIYDPDYLKLKGFKYFAIGRGEQSPYIK